MSRCVLLILDGFGVGEMPDVKEERAQDVGANTCLSILKSNKNLKLPNLESLGLMNVLNDELNGMKKAKKATFGKAKLMHYGADTFFGHQEIMGTLPKRPLEYSIKELIPSIKEKLVNEGYNINVIVSSAGNKLITVNESMIIGDNIECDLGQAFNITAALDIVSFEEVVKVGKLVREIVEVPRVIAFGGKKVSFQEIINAIEEKGNFIGVNAPKSGVYKEGYLCVHLGYGVDSTVQIQSILGKNNIPVNLLGKAADVISNNYGNSYSIVDTKAVLDKTLEIVKENTNGLICTNVQETDLAGHEENSKKYAQKLKLADDYIGYIIKELKEDDILIVMADHGNDPLINHSKHTREMVPILVYGKNINNCDLSIRNSLSDVAKTIEEFFNVNGVQNGESFYNLILGNII